MSHLPLSCARQTWKKYWEAWCASCGSPEGLRSGAGAARCIVDLALSGLLHTTPSLWPNVLLRDVQFCANRRHEHRDAFRLPDLGSQFVVVFFFQDDLSSIPSPLLHLVQLNSCDPCQCCREQIVEEPHSGGVAQQIHVVQEPMSDADTSSNAPTPIEKKSGTSGSPCSPPLASPRDLPRTCCGQTRQVALGSYSRISSGTARCCTWSRLCWSSCNVSCVLGANTAPLRQCLALDTFLEGLGDLDSFCMENVPLTFFSNRLNGRTKSSLPTRPCNGNTLNNFHALTGSCRVAFQVWHKQNLVRISVSMS